MTSIPDFAARLICCAIILGVLTLAGDSLVRAWLHRRAEHRLSAEVSEHLRKIWSNR